MPVLALIVSALALLMCGGVIYPLIKRIDALESAPLRPSGESYDDSALRAVLDQHADSIDDLQQAVADQTIAIAEGIQHVDRAERRVRAAVGRARRRMEDAGYVDDGLEAEAQELQFLNGEGSVQETMQPVREGVEGAQGGDSGRDMSVFPGQW